MYFRTLKQDSRLGLSLSANGPSSCCRQSGAKRIHRVSSDFGKTDSIIELIVNSLCQNGVVDPKSFYESPSTDFDAMGIVGVFDAVQCAKIDKLVRAIKAPNQNIGRRS